MKYLFRRGDGNEGNFPRFMVELGPNDCPYAALKALVANDYIAGRAIRRHIIRNLEIEGEPEHSIHGTVYEGPHGENAFGAAWLTAELQPAEDGEDGECYALRKILDYSALQLYRAWAPPRPRSISSAAKVLGQRGGAVRAQSLSPKRRSEIAQKAANARWAKEDQQS